MVAGTSFDSNGIISDALTLQPFTELDAGAPDTAATDSADAAAAADDDEDDDTDDADADDAVAAGLENERCVCFACFLSI